MFHGIQAIEKRGVITIKIEADKDTNKLIIRIIDNGIGMNKEVLKSCLAPKKQDENTSKSYRIGLSNVKQRIEYLYEGTGSLTVESKENIGTEIFIILPVNK